jgi:hypothetical protein
MLGQMFPIPPYYRVQKIVSGISNRMAYHGRRRFEEMMKRAFLPELLVNDRDTRGSLIDKIPNLCPAFQNLWNPYVIKKLDAVKFGEPIYYIAAARRKK